MLTHQWIGVSKRPSIHAKIAVMCERKHISDCGQNPSMLHKNITGLEYQKAPAVMPKLQPCVKPYYYQKHTYVRCKHLGNGEYCVTVDIGACNAYAWCSMKHAFDTPLVCVDMPTVSLASFTCHLHISRVLGLYVPKTPH